MRERIILFFFIFVLGLLPIRSFSETYEISELSILSINSAITPATYDYLNQSFKNLPKKSLVVIKINTPGGLITTTKDIITLFGREKRPIAVWITPEGASASSAGAIIASAAHFIFMSPGTNIGAATPVGLGEDIKEGDGRKKAMSDLTALVRSLNASRGRPSAPFEKMITNADSYTDKEALELKIIDGVLSNERDMIPYFQNKTIALDGTEQALRVDQVVSREYEATIGQKILEVLANPSTAYILFLMGVALIYFELQAPGGFIAGSIGVSLLILAGIAFQVLPLHWGSFGLIGVGIVFLVMEIFITSYGILSLLGIAAFVMGSLFLFNSDAGFISVEYPIILSTFAGVISAIGFLLWYIWRDQRKQKPTGDFFLPTGARGIILTKSDLLYQVKVKGEIWNAQSDELLNVGDHVEVSRSDTNQLLIKVKKIVES